MTSSNQPPKPRGDSMLVILMKGAMGLGFGLVFLYGMWRLIAQRPLACNARTAMMYMGIAFPVFCFFEVTVGYGHTRFFGHPLWQYHIQPIHGGQTSVYNFAIWPLYGWHLYLCDQTLENWALSRPFGYVAQGLKHSCSGPLLEILANLGMLWAIGRYYFYYLPDDLWHLTSIQVVPYYALTSLLFSWVLKQAKRWGRPLAAGSVGYLIGLAIILSGL